MKNLKSTLMMASLIGGSFFAVSCNTTPAEQREKMNEKMETIEDKALDANTARNWEKERADVLEDFRDLRNNIDNKLAEVHEDLAKTDLKPSVKADMEAMKAELVREKNIVEAKLKNVENATSDTWDMTKSDAENTAKEVETWWQKQKEKVDLKTAADHDKDGH